MPATRSLAQHTIALFQAARAANLAVPSLRGHVVELTVENGSDVLVTADIHGDRLSFERILEIAALEKHPRRHLILQEVCHGGPSYPNDGGCMSHLLVEDVAQLKLNHPERVHYLLSNHELSEATDFPVAKAGQMLNLHFREGLQDMYGEAGDDVHSALKAFLLSCPAAARVAGSIFLSHSLPSKWEYNASGFAALHREWNDDDLAPGGDIFRLVWGRDYRRENAAAFANTVGAKVLIHGHEPCPDGVQAPNDLQVILDTSGEQACYALLPLDRELNHSGVLACVHKLHG